MRVILLFIVSFFLTACASTEYVQYAKTQEAIEVAKANAEASRFKALGDIAKDGDGASKVAAVMALALGNNSNSQQNNNVVAPERNQALQWASILVPGLTQVYGIRANASVAIHASDNAAATSIATTNGFVGLVNKNQGSSNVTTTNVGSVYNTSGNSGANSGNTTPSTTSTNYSISGNSGSNSGNSTATPTVVNQPPPVVITQPSPTIVTQPPPVVVQPSYPPAIRP